jgi:hypothetical protein
LDPRCGPIFLFQLMTQLPATTDILQSDHRINLRSSGVKYMHAVANWYASISNLTPRSNKLVL